MRGFGLEHAILLAATNPVTRVTSCPRSPPPLTASELPNPFVIASGPPGTNLNVIHRAFREGWGAVIAKTISLDASKVINVTPRYGKLHANDKREIVGWENIELISDRPIENLARGV